MAAFNQLAVCASACSLFLLAPALSIIVLANENQTPSTSNSGMDSILESNYFWDKHLFDSKRLTYNVDDNHHHHHDDDAGGGASQVNQQVPERLPIVVSSSDNSYVSASPIINTNNEIISTTATTTSSSSTTLFAQEAYSAALASERSDHQFREMGSTSWGSDSGTRHRVHYKAAPGIINNIRNFGQFNRHHHHFHHHHHHTRDGDHHHHPHHNSLNDLLQHQRAKYLEVGNQVSLADNHRLYSNSFERNGHHPLPPYDIENNVGVSDLFVAYPSHQDASRSQQDEQHFTEKLIISPQELSPAYTMPSSAHEDDEIVLLADTQDQYSTPMNKLQYSNIVRGSQNVIGPLGGGGRYWQDSHLASIKIEQEPGDYERGGLNSAVIAILFGVGVTGMLVMVVTHKMRSIKRRVNWKDRRRSLVPDSDILIQTIPI